MENILWVSAVGRNIWQRCTIAVKSGLLAGLVGRDRVRLNRLIWDVCDSEFGGRQEICKRFFAEGPTRRMSSTYLNANLAEDIRMVEGLLGVALPLTQ